jgi:hypothetical protein
VAQKSPKPIAGSFMMSGGGWFGNSIPIGTLLSEIPGNARLGAPLVDQTGLRGYYDFTMKVSYDKGAPLLIDQVETQMGLRVEPRKRPLKVHIIDSAEKPSVDGAEVQAPNADAPVSMDKTAKYVSTMTSDVASVRVAVTRWRGRG